MNNESLTLLGKRLPLNASTMAAICARVAAGEGLRSICRDKSMPARSTVQSWLAESEEFQRAMRLARDLQADELAEEIIEIADNEPDPMRAKLRMDARRWYALKLRPKKYGERVEHGIESDAPAEIRVVIGGNPRHEADQ